MINRKCGWCHAYSAHQLTQSADLEKKIFGDYDVTSVYQCTSCKAYSSVVWLDEEGMDWGDSLEAAMDNVHWVPDGAPMQAPEGTPQQIAQAFQEVERCITSAVAPRAAVGMARSTLEAIAKHRGVTEGSLYQKIDELHTKGFISERIKDAAHAIRGFGNESAHGDFEQDIEMKDAQDCFNLLQVVLTEVYYIESLTQEMERRVQARKDERAEAKNP